PPPFEIRVPVPPGPLVSGDTRYFVYELLITSFLPAPAQVSRVEVFAESADGPRLLEYSGEELGANMLPPFLQEDDPVVQRTIEPRSHGVVYVMLPLPASVATPRQFYHRVWFDLPAGDSTEADYVALETPVHEGSVIEIGPPLRGGPWAVFNGPSNDSGHRRMPLQLFGRSAFAQRYAIDYMLVDAEGRASPVEGGDNDTYPGYGAEVIAVADGVISSVLDGVPENRPGETSRPADFNLSTAIGNHVILHIGDGRYALYAHLLPGSVSVQVGQQVRRGQVLGQVGNSGNSGGPHLHFHVTDENVPLGAEGLPFVHDAFDLLGFCRQGPAGPCEMHEPETRRGETPMRDQLIRFPR
ncbi:MAG: M23 family metallopeptidase, partial [Gemmatimonadetes bacterium]|nr:M23 family metallopeptidase [Gemmatimonadota bacterium]MYJ38658.1 M23 family metallopeptidase [Gemmatimonadota bacterium]